MYGPQDIGPPKWSSMEQWNDQQYSIEEPRDGLKLIYSTYK